MHKCAHESVMIEKNVLLTTQPNMNKKKMTSVFCSETLGDDIN